MDPTLPGDVPTGAATRREAPRILPTNYPVTYNGAMTKQPRTVLGLGEASAVTVSPVRRGRDGKWVTVRRDKRVKADAWRGRARFVDWEGNAGEVSRRASTEHEAIAAVEQALRERLRMDESSLDAGTSLLTACERWLEDSARPESGRSARTVAAYVGAYERSVRGARRDHRGNVTAEVSTPIKGLTLAQANDAQRLTRFLRGVADERGTASAKHVRAVLTGVLQHAVTMGVLQTNAMRSVGRVAAKRDNAPPDETRRNTRRALTDAERSAVLEYVGKWSSEPNLHPGTAAHRRAVADLVRMLAGTGMRIGEALALRWEHVDLRTGATHVPGTKSASAVRTVTLPDWLRRAMAERALLVGRTGLVFAAPRLSDRERPWNASNCSHSVTAVLAAAGVPWARSHTFRKTVASRLSDAGVPLREVADQLGHRDAGFTASTYLGRSFTGEKSALAQHL